MRTSVGHADGKNTEDVGNKETLDSGDEGLNRWERDSDKKTKSQRQKHRIIV